MDSDRSEQPASSGVEKPCTTIRCQTCQRATDDPAHVYGCDCKCNWFAHIPGIPVLGGSDE